jgi:hypothetical protein
MALAPAVRYVCTKQMAKETCAPDGALCSAPAGAGGLKEDTLPSTRIMPLPGQILSTNPESATLTWRCIDSIRRSAPQSAQHDMARRGQERWASNLSYDHFFPARRGIPRLRRKPCKSTPHRRCGIFVRNVRQIRVCAPDGALCSTPPGQVVAAGGIPGFNKDSVPPGRLAFPDLYNLRRYIRGFALVCFSFFTIFVNLLSHAIYRPETRFIKMADHPHNHQDLHSQSLLGLFLPFRTSK